MRRATVSMFAHIVQLLPQSFASIFCLNLYSLSSFKSIRLTRPLKESAQEISLLP